jgi:hypothetical protein
MRIVAALLLAALWVGGAAAQEGVYVTIVVKACPLDPSDYETCAPAAFGAAGLPIGQCPRATNMGQPESQRERAPSLAERHAYEARIGCIDVPIPPEVIHGNGEMTMDRCRGHAGYLAALQYLEQNPTIAQKAVGEWVCIMHAFPVSGVAGM